ncbi:MAG: arsenosugar biosynthesis radical SAM protein ArsS [Dehalococcoidia bacterium]
MEQTLKPANPGQLFDYRFDLLLEQYRLSPCPTGIDTLWVNITRKCNQACTHCHVEASPQRTEDMDDRIIDACLFFLRDNDECTCLDITGGAPELHPLFEYMVIEARAMGKRVVTRTNLTVFFDGDPSDDGSKDYLPDFFAENNVELIASLPHYNPDITDRIRGKGVHNKSLRAIKMLNDRGYGKGELILNLMHNSNGPLSPIDRQCLEDVYRKELSDSGLYFDKLYTVTNVAINRFREFLEQEHRYVSYMENLAAAFSPLAVDNLACRSLISVGPDGRIYDCDFNQMLNLPVIVDDVPLTIFDVRLTDLLGRKIIFGSQCFGCTSGGGSS